MTIEGWLAKEKDDEELGELVRGCMRANSRLTIEGPGWAGPIYWLESLPRARWWAWLRVKIIKLETYLCGDGNRNRLD